MIQESGRIPLKASLVFCRESSRYWLLSFVDHAVGRFTTSCRCGASRKFKYCGMGSM